MTTITLVSPVLADSLNIYFRLFDNTGQAFDFNDNTFKSLSTATTPYVTATERADMDGTSFSHYTATVNLANVNYDASMEIYWKTYDNVAPADTDVAVSAISSMWVTFGEITNAKPNLVVYSTVNVKSTAGSTAQVKCWLELDGTKIDLITADAAVTGTVAVREHGSASNLFSKALVVGDIPTGAKVLEAEQASPGFTDDRAYQVTGSIVINGTTYSSDDGILVIG